MMLKHTGLIKFIDVKKQMGFINPSDGQSKDIFFRFSSYSGDADTLRSGIAVEFILGEDEAVEIKPL